MNNPRGSEGSRSDELRLRDFFASRPSGKLRKELERLHSSRSKDSYSRMIILEEVLANRSENIFSGLLSGSRKRHR